MDGERRNRSAVQVQDIMKMSLRNKEIVVRAVKVKKQTEWPIFFETVDSGRVQNSRNSY